MTFFINETDRCHKTKLYWLLFYLDLKCLAQFKKSITGLKYKVRDYGPIPFPLEHWIMNQVKKNGDKDLSNYFKIEKNNEYTFTPKQDFNENKFSPVQIKIMKEYAEIFKHSQTIDFDKEKKELQKELVNDFDTSKILEKLREDKYLTVGLIMKDGRLIEVKSSKKS